MTMNTPPTGLAEMIARPNWVGYKREARPGESKPTKIPYQVAQERGSDVKAKAGDPSTWDTWPRLAEALAAGRFDGAGYEFHAGEGLVGIDIDNCRDAATGALTPLARAAICLADTYAEPSPSGTGIHIIGKGELPRPEIAEDRQGKNQGGREMYGGAHFFTMTFLPFADYDTLKAVDAETMRRLFLLLWPEEARAKPTTPPPPPPKAPATPDDDALLDKAFAAKGGDEFSRQHHGTYLDEDKSADDFAYLGRVRFWAQGDPARMRRIALASGRVRPKWHTRRGAGDWLDFTIGNSLKGAYEVYDPARATPPPPSTGNTDAARLLAERDATIATLRADVARLGDQVRREREEGARKDATIIGLRDDLAACEAVIAHPEQAAGVGALDLIEATERAYAKGDVLTKDGRDYARVPFSQAAKRRDAKTTGRGYKALVDGGKLDTFTRDERIETATYKGEVPIAYIHIAPELRGRRGAAVLSILPTPAAKRHGGRRTIAVPEEVANQPHPVRRKRESVTRWYDALDDRQLVVETATIGTDFWTAQGEQRTREEIDALRERAGYQPAPVPAYRPTAPPTQPTLRIVPHPEPRQDAEVSEPRQDADINQVVNRRQDAEVSPLVEDAPGRCGAADCGRRATIYGYCADHYPHYAGRYDGAYGFAAGGG